MKRNVPVAPALIRWGVCIYLTTLAIPLGPELPLTLLAALVFITFISTSLSISSVPREVAITLGLFLGSMLISCLLSISLEVSIIACLSFIPALFLFIVISTVFTSDDLRLISMTISITALLIAWIFCTVAFLNPGVSAQDWIDLAGYPHIGVPNDLGILAIMGAVSATSLYSRCQGAVKYLSVVTLLSIIACLVTYQSRGSILTLMLTSIIMMMALSRARQIATVLAIMLAVVFAIDLLTGLSFSSKLMEIDRLTVRLPLWISALQMFLDAPLFGLGPGAYSQVYQEYVANLELPAWIWMTQRHMPWPHNVYLELLAERGITGLAAFLFFIIALYRTAYVSFHSGMTKYEKSTLLAAVFALTALLISGIYESSLLRHWVLIMYFLYAGMICTIWKSQANTIIRSH